jgi:MinD superfamily P-loop ATPase
MIRVKNQDVFESEIKLVENPAADARFEVLKASLTEHEEEMLKLLEDLMEKVKEGKFDEVIHDSRDLVNLAHKANDILDKLPKIK